MLIVGIVFTASTLGCGLQGKVTPIVKIGEPSTVLASAIDIQRVAEIVPANSSFANSVTSSNLTVEGTCISGSAAVSISLVSTDVNLVLACDESTGGFSGALDISQVPDGTVTLSIAFLKTLTTSVPIYVVQRTIVKDTSELAAFTIPSAFTESSSAIILDAVEGAAFYRATFTPVAGGSAIGPIQSSSNSIPVTSLAMWTSYTVSAVALDAAGNISAANNTGTFTKNATIRATLSGNLPAGVTAVSFYKMTGESSIYCSPGFNYCNPNMNVTDAITLAGSTSINAGQTITIGSNLLQTDMYYIAPINPAGIACEANVASPALWAFVTADVTIDIICRLDPPNPTDFSATVVSSSQIDLSWTSGGGGTVDYRLAYQAGAVAPADCSSTGTGITLMDEGNTSTQITGLTTNTVYSFRLCSIKSLDEPESAGVTATATTAR